MPNAAPIGSEALRSPSLVTLATDAIRRKILAGEYDLGERLIEERLTKELEISRPPLREALRLLENEGLVVTKPRRGSFVATLTQQDVFEILTLRSTLERMAFELGIPLANPALLDSARDALSVMEECARQEDRGELVRAGYAFHAALIHIANHTRLEDIYASVQQQLILCMSQNLIARERYFEDLVAHVARHRKLLELVESGDGEAALKELAAHGERTFQLRPKEDNAAQDVQQGRE